MNGIIIQMISTENQLYKRELLLRNEILRIPIGLNIKDEDLGDEVNQIHFVAMLNSEVVGVVLMKVEGKIGKLRQMAVKSEIQGKQIGRQLVEALELHALIINLDEIKLHARHYAVGFYEKLGYQQTSKPVFEEVGMQHFELWKKLC
ncbi:MAG: N-acetylglutamate synthase-like GNAT family acetyltransferase [Algoriphagus sp.]|jgi:N-acetylglutamate synthase-like GNAT family acetyltransferase